MYRRSIILLLLLAVACIGWGPMMLSVKPGSPDCASGTYDAAYNADYPSDTDKLCLNSGASNKDGTVTGATINSSYGRTGNGVQIDADDERINWAQQADSTYFCDDAACTVWLYVKTPEEAWDGDTNVFEIYDGANNRINGWIDTDGEFNCRHRGQSSSVEVNGDDAIVVQMWTAIACTWTVASNAVAVQVGANGWDVDGDADTVTEFLGGEPDNFRIGLVDAPEGFTDEVYIDDVRTINSYQASYP